MKFKSDLANEYYLSFLRTGNPCFYVLAADFEKTETLREQVLSEAENSLSL